MMLIKPKTIYRLTICLAIIICSMQASFGQTVRQEKMAQLSYMVGEWIGTSTSYENDTIVKQGPAFEKVSYKLDSNIITIDLHSESLQLHTVIYYDEIDQTYYYNPYYKTGVGKYRGEYKEGQFMVWFSENRRLIFRLTPEGDFQEYGEKREQGVWKKYFEDILKKTP